MVNNAMGAACTVHRQANGMESIPDEVVRSIVSFLKLSNAIIQTSKLRLADL